MDQSETPTTDPISPETPVLVKHKTYFKKIYEVTVLNLLSIVSKHYLTLTCKKSIFQFLFPQIFNATILTILGVERPKIEYELFLIILVIIGICFSAVALVVQLLNIKALVMKTIWVVIESVGCVMLTCLFGFVIILIIQDYVRTYTAVVVVS
jgi:hypothetical protein